MNRSFRGDTLQVAISNPIHAPLRITAQSENSVLNEVINTTFPITLPPLLDTVFIVTSPVFRTDSSVRFGATIGDPTASIQPQAILFPFPKGKSYSIMQPYNGRLSHQTDYSRYALDFDLAVGDTISAADDGYVVGVVQAYKNGGKDKKWRDYANFITLFHPHSGLYTQYVHLIYNGSFVDVGDTVTAGQPIGISGETGFTTKPHLHFNVLKPTESGMKSTPTRFKNGKPGLSLKRGDVVRR
ncbi:MAG: M23 family metallopeptidase [Bacteroidota bacterium]